MSKIEVIDCGGFSLDQAEPQQKQQQQQQQVQQVQQVQPKRRSESTLLKREVTKTISDQNKKGDIKQHQEYVLMLSRYGTSPRFGKYLESLSFELTVPKLKKQSGTELEELLERVRTSVANKTVSDLWTDTIMSGVNMAESLCEMTKVGENIRLKGITEVLKTDESFLDLCEELKLNNQNLAYTSPYTRLAYTLLTVGFHVHSVNTLVEKRNNKKKIEPKDVRKDGNIILDKQVDISTKQKRVDPGERVFQID